MSVPRLVLSGMLILPLLLAGCAAPRSGEPDPQPENEHKFHSTQEHYDRAGAIPDR